MAAKLLLTSMKFHGSLQFPRLNAKKNNGPILHFALRKLEKLNQGNFLLAGIWYRPKITQYTVALKLYPGCLQTLSFTLPLSPPLLSLPLFPPSLHFHYPLWLSPKEVERGETLNDSSVFISLFFTGTPHRMV